ncbi:YybH family protein [Thalassobacillus devorans]|uniref:YybH family protein n=1 Tax=Thalassobacillus devorans TaxID=279813 RepID=UPI00048AAA9C|nr:nuclear transport factor 2 family protein [Thalassobacillus devorans]
MASTPQQALKMLVEATNTHDLNVAEFISEEAVYYFSDEIVYGHENLKKYFDKTWAHICDEDYHVHHITWISNSDTVAVCIYKFQWEGKIDGILKERQGRGTNVFEKDGQGWKVVHEHLSALD